MLVYTINYLEEDLNGTIDHAHPSAQESEKRENKLDEVVGQSLKAVKPPRGAMQVIGQGVGHWLGLRNDGEIEV